MESQKKVCNTPKDLAKLLGISDKQVRNVLRDITTEQPGSGGRWNLSFEKTGKTAEEWMAIYKNRRSRTNVAAVLK